MCFLRNVWVRCVTRKILSCHQKDLCFNKNQQPVKPPYRMNPHIHAVYAKLSPCRDHVATQTSISLDQAMLLAVQWWWHPYHGLFFSVRFERQSGTWYGVLLLWSIHFKIWLVVWFKMHSCTSLWYRAVTCIFVGHLSARTNLVVLLWPRLAKKAFLSTNLSLTGSLFVCSCIFFFLLVAPFWLNWSHCSEWTS